MSPSSVFVSFVALLTSGQNVNAGEALGRAAYDLKSSIHLYALEVDGTGEVSGLKNLHLPISLAEKQELHNKSLSFLLSAAVFDMIRIAYSEPFFNLIRNHCFLLCRKLFLRNRYF